MRDIAMMSMRNGLHRTEEPMTSPFVRKGSQERRINLQRETQPTMLRMTMSLSRDPQREKHQSVHQGKSPGRHWVCGHFKARATGIFWWSPHARGDASRDLTDLPKEIRVIKPRESIQAICDEDLEYSS